MRFLALLLVSAIALLADPPMTRLRVEVKTPGGNPVDRANVIVKFIQGRSKVKLGKRIMTSWEMKTNQEGWTKCPPIPQGRILVQVIAKGYQTYGQQIDVNEEERTVEVKLQEPQEQHSVHENPKK